MMTNKAYIVANEQQEREVLEKLEREGMRWIGGNYVPSNSSIIEFPYVLFKRNKICWGYLEDLSAEEIVYDGRKEDQMSEKYVVSQEFMNELEEWRDYCFEEYDVAINSGSIEDLPIVVNAWWGDEVPDEENNNRLIAIIRWVNGEDVFEVEKPKKWVVRSKDSSEAGRHLYVRLDISYKVKDTTTLWGINKATKFDTKEEAESWANAHQEVVEVVDV